MALDNNQNGYGSVKANAMQYDEEIVISLQDIMQILRSNLTAIVLMAIIGGVVCGICTKVFVRPQYRSVARMYVVSTSDNSLLQLSELELGTKLAADYVEMMMSRPMLEEVISELSLENTYTATSLGGHITIENPTDTRILNVSATCDNPQLAADIANTLAEVSAKNLSDIMETAPPKVFQKAVVDLNKVSPSYSKNTLIGIIAGAALTIAVAVLLYLLDDTLKSEDDISRYSDLANFASINAAPERRKKQKRGGKDEYSSYGEYK